ncbi:MAG: tetratricopeptide repeat protein [Candidatus Krumholzibacteriota bacterium]|nr:tetratricopeptide repeat protein [Candidatus Krumholzibacteriota bacterium]
MSGKNSNEIIIDLESIRNRKKAVISCCMITRDEGEFIENAIESVKGLADEIIIVDTGSVDDTARKAERLGARVFTCEWRNDFSEARNRAISKASGEWILILDADEIIEEKDHSRIARLIRQYPEAAFMFEQWTYTNDSDTFGWKRCDDDARMNREMLGYFQSQQVRLFRNTELVRYEGQVHEDVERSLASTGIPIIKVEDIIIHHYGRMKDSERMNRKHRMYLSLGEKKLGANPGNSKYIFELASQMLGLGNAEESLHLIDKGLDIVPESWEFLNLKGLAFLRQGRIDEAVDSFSRAVLINSEKPDLYNNLGVAYNENRQPEEALKAMKKGLSIDPRNANILRNLATSSIMVDDLDSALEYITSSLELDPFMAQSHVIHADILFRQGNQEDSVESLEKIRFLPGTDLKVYLKSIYIYTRMKMAEKAGEVVERALSEYPGHEGLTFLSGKVFELKGEIDEALKVYESIISMNPYNSEVLNSLGCLNEKQGRLERAREYFTEAYRLSPYNMQIEVNLGIILGKLGIDAEAERHLKAVIKKDGQNGAALNAFGCFLSKRDRYAEAIAFFTRAIENNRQDIHPYLNLGLVCEKMNKPDKAVEIYEKLAIIDPSSRRLVEFRLRKLQSAFS